MKHNYLNNKDILKEIHKSKTTYCSYTQPEYADYDMILPEIGKINKKNILEARKLRAERLAKLAHEAATADGTKHKLDEFEIKLKDVPATDVVFRVMTWDHIPVDDAKTKKARMNALEIEDDEDPLITEYDEMDLTHTKYVKVNFPPFHHYKVDEEGNPVLVGKSHWKGDLETGEFSTISEKSVASLGCRVLYCVFYRSESRCRIRRNQIEFTHKCGRCFLP